MNPIVFTATCRRDEERFRVCALTQEKYLGWRHVAAMQKDGARPKTYDWADVPHRLECVHEGDTWFPTPSYLRQQFNKLYSAEIAGDSKSGVEAYKGWMFHVDSDMWFEPECIDGIKNNVGLWIHDKPNTMVWPMLEKWAETCSWLLGVGVPIMSFMLETRGWWLHSEVLHELRYRIYKAHGKHIYELVPELEKRQFSEYQLYASYAWLFAREQHSWLDKREAGMLLPSTVGRDLPLFVPHWTSGSEAPPECLARWEELLR
jgi:hypothetical protein